MKDLTYRNVLFVGPNYRNHKGGIGAVLSVYQKNIPDFQFLASYDGNFSGIKNLIFYFVFLLRLIVRLIADRKIRIVHIHGASRGSFYRKLLAFIISKTFRKKTIYHIHGAEYHIFYGETNGLVRSLIRWMLNHADQIICLSGRWKTFFQGISRNKNIATVHNPIDLPAQVNHAHQQKAVNFLFLGRIGDRKGIFDLLQSIENTPAITDDNFKLRIGGDGEKEKLIKWIASPQLAQKVEFVGWVDGELKKRLLDGCDVLVLPSYNEGLPVSVLEAMGYGKAIISTNVGGIPEIVTSQVNGFLIEPGDQQALSDSITFLINNRNRLPEMGAASRKIAEDYDIVKVMEQLTGIYQSLQSEKK